MRWITRERPKVDRVACPWLIARFIDDNPEFLFTPPAEVADRARESGAIPYDIEGVELTHDGERCSFEFLPGRKHPAVAKDYARIANFVASQKPLPTGL